MFKLSVYLKSSEHKENRRTFTVVLTCICIVKIQYLKKKCVQNVLRISWQCKWRHFQFCSSQFIEFRCVLFARFFFRYSFDKFVNISYWRKKTFRFVKCSLHVNVSHRFGLWIWFALKLYANASPAGKLYVCVCVIECVCVRGWELKCSWITKNWWSQPDMHFRNSFVHSSVVRYTPINKLEMLCDIFIRYFSQKTVFFISFYLSICDVSVWHTLRSVWMPYFLLYINRYSLFFCSVHSLNSVFSCQEFLNWIFQTCISFGIIEANELFMQ